MALRIFFMLLLSSSLLSCLREAPQGSSGGTGNAYARGFRIESYRGFSVLHVSDPWQGSEGVHLSYLLAEQGAPVPDSLAGLTRIPVPVRRVICMSTTHIAMIRTLGKAESIVGISGKDYVSDPGLRERMERGLVRDVGADQALNYELVVSLRPDVLIAYGVTGEVSGQVNRLRDLGIPVVLDGDYLEGHPLGKLEWIRFLAALYREEGMADSIFLTVEKSYREIREKAGAAGTRPRVMTGLPWKGSWYIPGGAAFPAAFIRDAGASYVWEEIPGREALPMGLETVFSKAASADVWINCGSARSLAEIERTDARLDGFQPFRTGQVYNNTARMNPSGGNDFWESGVMNPQIILADLVRIFHPEIFPDHELVYYEKLE